MNAGNADLNYELVAVQLGDRIKWGPSERSLNEIDRIAWSIFEFSRQDHPHPNITSMRAQLVYDWILTLHDQNYSSQEKYTILVKFVEELCPSFLQEPYFIDNQNTLLDKFDSCHFHPKIQETCRELYAQKNYFHAVFEAAKLYNNLVKDKSNLDADGQDLMMKAWAPEKGSLQLNACESETERDYHDGIKFLSAGLMRAIRNITAHELRLEWPIDQQDATDILSLISFLLRQLDKAKARPKN